MYGAALNKYAAFLAANENNTLSASVFFADLLAIANENERAVGFDPDNQEDARRKMLRQIVVRQGQRKFRATLIKAYGAKCAITHCGVLDILEAAHITPYLGAATNLPANGILLRSDIHTLWDLGLVAIDPYSLRVLVNPQITDETYRSLHGTTATEPTDLACKPSSAALKAQWTLFQK